MLDPRIRTLADNLVNYSCDLQPGETLLLEAIDIPPEVVATIVEAVVRKGGIPLTTIKQSVVLRALYRNATEAGMRQIGEYETRRMEGVQAYIGLRPDGNCHQ